MNPIGHLRRAVRRHAQLADATIALVVFTVTVVPAFAGQASATTGSRTLAVGTAVVACGALGLRRLHPLAALAVSVIAAEVFIAEPGDGNGVLILLAPSIALYTVAEQVKRRRSLVIGVGVLAALTITHAVAAPESLGPQNLAFAALGGLAIAAGDSSRNRRAYLAEVERRAERAELEREQDARRRVAAERLRIARDLHDSVGHHLALISVQSDVAGRAVIDDAAAAREALGHVKSASRKALEELRDTISLLRQPGDPAAPTEVPAPGLDALAELLTELRGSGLAIDRQVTGTAVPLAPAADRTAYLVILESLTNVYKHSAYRRARLTLDYHRRELRVTVDDLGDGGSSERGEVKSRLVLNPGFPFQRDGTGSPACGSECSPSAGSSPRDRARETGSGSPRRSPTSRLRSSQSRRRDHPRGDRRRSAAAAERLQGADLR